MSSCEHLPLFPLIPTENSSNPFKDVTTIGGGIKIGIICRGGYIGEKYPTSIIIIGGAGSINHIIAGEMVAVQEAKETSNNLVSSFKNIEKEVFEITREMINRLDELKLFEQNKEGQRPSYNLTNRNYLNRNYLNSIKTKSIKPRMYKHQNR